MFLSSKFNRFFRRFMQWSLGAVCGVIFVVGCGEMAKEGGQVSLVSMSEAIAQTVINAIEVAFNPENTTLVSANMQDAFQEMDFKVENLSGSVALNKQDIDALESDVAAINNAVPGCASGMVNMGSYCIDINPSGNGPYTTATQACYSAGQRLCRPAELVYACQSAAIAGVNSWEWSDTTVGGDDGIALLDDGDCDNSRSASVNTNYSFRCCADPS